MREVELGDEPFDSAFYLEGRRGWCARCSTWRRAACWPTCTPRAGLEIVGGEIQVEMLDVQARPTFCPSSSTSAGGSLGPKRSYGRLAENAHHDPVAAVRLQNLLLLVREFPGIR